MLPHSTFGIRFKTGSRSTRPSGGSGGGGKSLTKETPIMANILAAFGQSLERVPFYKLLYRQGKRG